MKQVDNENDMLKVSLMKGSATYNEWVECYLSRQQRGIF